MSTPHKSTSVLPYLRGMQRVPPLKKGGQGGFAGACRTAAAVLAALYGSPPFAKGGQGGFLSPGRVAAAILFAAMAAAPVHAADTPIEATTASGDLVLLHPNGRWSYVDEKKAEAAKKVADQYPENQGRPFEAQGGLFGVGRTLMPGDKDYNRGSLNPKMR